MNISYDLWPIWADYLEEQGQDTELLRYILTWGFSIPGMVNQRKFYFQSGYLEFKIEDTTGFIPFNRDNYSFPYYEYLYNENNGNGYIAYYY